MRDHPLPTCFRAVASLFVALAIDGSVAIGQDSREAGPTAVADTQVKVRGLRRLDETTLRLGGNGDNWHMTWAADGRQYAGLCDGFGWPEWPQKWFNTRVLAIDGEPPGVRFEYLPSYPDLVNRPGLLFGRYYGFGILAVDGRIYQFLATPNRPFHQPEPRFVGTKLIYSSDGGKTWHNRDGSAPVVWEPWDERSRKNMTFFEEDGDTFSLLTVLQMGQEYGQNRDGYVYVYAPNGSMDGTMNQLVMFRVPKERLLERAAYEFFVSRAADGGAEWSADITDRGPVHTFPSGWVSKTLSPYAWQPSVVYVEALGVYLMANWGMGCDEKGEWFQKPSYLGFWTAPRPWGPWKQIHEETAWTPGGDRLARAYQPQIAPKWIAADGKSFWLVWTEYQEVEGKGRPFYAFNAQKVEALTE